MITELGHYALILALATALVQSLVPLIGAQRNDAGMMAVGPMAANLSFVLVAFSFLTLTYAYVISDFSLLNVVENSHSMKPMLYKITGVWGNHEGSMLLWVLILVLFSSLVASFGRNLPDKLRANVLSVQAWITVAFLLFILLTSNPFIRLTNPPAEGNDLNPILQDLGLAIHPPLLYLGYVGFSISFSFAAAALIEGRLDAAWARWVRPWTLVAWTFLTAGISMGSYWAYYELGWGGWWFWDPVENASFMPWLAGTALLHSALVMEKREALKVWTVLLSILTFSFSLLGTFLVRSGVLTSVHAFATDPARGVFILGILAVFIGGAFALFGLRATALRTGGLFAPISREGALVLNNLFLTTATATVFVGTLYPLLLEATTGTKISVGAPFFNLTFGPLMIPLMIAVPFGPLLAWKRGDLMGATQRLYAAIGISILVGLVATFVAVTIGVTYGAISGFYGGRIDVIMMRTVDTLLSIPFLMVVIVLQAVLSEWSGTTSKWIVETWGWNKEFTNRATNVLPLFFALGLFGWLTLARIVRAQVLSLKEREFVEAATSLGLSRLRVLFRHIIPNTLGPTVVYATLTVPGFIMYEATLSYLGLGVESPT
mgnify:CR=1 FL=1